ncbi:MAG: magnesium transporter CorA family protein [Thiohalocapsa sp.]
MLALHTSTGDTAELGGELHRAALPGDAAWLDLHDPSDSETAFVERTTHLRLPTRGELSEIESSSRLRSEDGALYLSAPLIFRATAADPRSTPVGFVLTPQRLITLRFEPLTAFEAFAKTARGDAAEMFIGLVEAIVDRLADVLEALAAELDVLSHRLFRSGPIGGPRHRPAREAADLRAILRRVGAGGDLVSKIRDSLLGLARIVPYVAGQGAGWLADGEKLRLETLRHDIASLSDYDTHLVNKVQLLLDATLGLINVEQNDIIKVLTIVSVVGVPPTLVASMYGMNFKHMPELDWAWGYPYGLALIALSAVAPLLWFRWRGWF